MKNCWIWAGLQQLLPSSQFSWWFWDLSSRCTLSWTPVTCSSDWLAEFTSFQRCQVQRFVLPLTFPSIMLNNTLGLLSHRKQISCKHLTFLNLLSNSIISAIAATDTASTSEYLWQLSISSHASPSCGTPRKRRETKPSTKKWEWPMKQSTLGDNYCI